MQYCRLLYTTAHNNSHLYTSYICSYIIIAYTIQLTINKVTVVATSAIKSVISNYKKEYIGPTLHYMSIQLVCYA